MRLQTTLHGLPKAERVRARRRAARARRPDRRGRPQGRRLLRRHEAPARPGAGARALARAILFLDEPTTGLDPQSRADAVGGGRAPRPRGRRDRVPDHAVPRGGRRARRPRRDHRPGPDRGRGHARGAEGRDRPPERSRSIPSDPGDRDRARRPCSRASASCCDAPHGAVAVRLERGADELAPVVRALDAEDVGIEHFQLHSPSLDDVFLAKTGHKLDRATRRRRPASARSCRREQTTLLAQVGEMARRSVTQTLRQPALIVPPILFPLCLLAVNAGGLAAATKLPGLPDRQLPQLRDRDPVHAGRAVRVDQRGLEPRARRRDRLPEAPRADPDAALGAADRAASAA